MWMKVREEEATGLVLNSSLGERGVFEKERKLSHLDKCLASKLRTTPNKANTVPNNTFFSMVQSPC